MGVSIFHMLSICLIVTHVWAIPSQDQNGLNHSSIVDRFYELVNESAEKIVKYEFMVQLKNGTLDEKCFNNFRLNDLYYMSHGADNYVDASENAMGDDVRLYAKNQVGKYKKYYGDMLEDLPSIFKTTIMNGAIHWNVGPAFVEYVKFLNKAANDEKGFYAIISNAPCSMLWPYIGMKIPISAVTDDNPYKDFIRKNFGPWQWGAEDLVRKLANDYNYDKMLKIFKAGLSHEENIFLQSIDY